MMPVATTTLTATIADFIVKAAPPSLARERAAIAVTDTIGVALAGASEPAARIVRSTVAAESRGSCRILGTAERASAGEAAFANGVAVHALDFDDMCFVSMAHPSCALVPARSRPRNWPAPPAARCSMPTSSDSSSNAGLG